MAVCCVGDWSLILDSFNGDGECLGSLSSFFIFRVRCRTQHRYIIGTSIITAAIGPMMSASFVPNGIPVSPVAAAAADVDVLADVVSRVAVDVAVGEGPTKPVTPETLLLNVNIGRVFDDC